MKEIPSKYQITWIIAEPTAGIITAKDAKRMKLTRGYRNTHGEIWHASKEEADKHVQKIKQETKVTKEYKVYQITDAQYSRAKTDTKTGMTDFHPTSKQMKEAVVINRKQQPTKDRPQ